MQTVGTQISLWIIRKLYIWFYFLQWHSSAICLTQWISLAQTWRCGWRWRGTPLKERWRSGTRETRRPPCPGRTALTSRSGAAFPLASPDARQLRRGRTERDIKPLPDAPVILHLKGLVKNDRERFLTLIHVPGESVENASQGCCVEKAHGAQK